MGAADNNTLRDGYSAVITHATVSPFNAPLPVCCLSSTDRPVPLSLSVTIRLWNWHEIYLSASMKRKILFCFSLSLSLFSSCPLWPCGVQVALSPEVAFNLIYWFKLSAHLRVITWQWSIVRPLLTGKATSQSGVFTCRRSGAVSVQLVQWINRAIGVMAPSNREFEPAGVKRGGVTSSSTKFTFHNFWLAHSFRVNSIN